MNNLPNFIEPKLPAFHLNLQIIADEFENTHFQIETLCPSDPMCLDGLRIYQAGSVLSSSCLYLVPASKVNQSFQIYQQIDFLVVGKTNPGFFSDTCSVLFAGTEPEFAEVFNKAQQIFEKYQRWEKNLQMALGSVNPLDDMLTASLDIFHNPIFAHDTNFYILSCPRTVPGMSVWEKDSRTGREIAPLSLIHDFKVDVEYLHTLGTKGPNMYSEQMRGYRILYQNLWINGSYEGRICVDELQSEILPGHFQSLAYLASFIELCIRRHNLFQLNMGNDTRQFFSDYLDGTISDTQRVSDFLSFINWKLNDRYLCLRLEAEQNNDQMHSAVATLGHIETQIPEGRAFIYQQGITVIVNLSFNHSSISEVLSGLAIILREGLFKMGASSQLHDFRMLPQGYFQSVTALKLGKKSGSMIWCYRFDDYILEYILSESSKHLSPELLCSEKLTILKKYDQQNNTELYHTLQVFLNLERNVLQTANTLYIHRSTLFYRLERIRKLAKIDLENPKERLILMLSFCLLEHTDN